MRLSLLPVLLCQTSRAKGRSIALASVALLTLCSSSSAQAKPARVAKGQAQAPTPVQLVDILRGEPLVGSFDGDLRSLPVSREVRGRREPDAMRLPLAPAPDKNQRMHPSELALLAAQEQASSRVADDPGFDEPIVSLDEGSSTADADIDVGLNHVISTRNFHGFTIYDKDGQPLAGPISPRDFFQSMSGGRCKLDSNSPVDVLINYDKDADRWISTHITYPDDNNSGAAEFCVAVAKTSDPISGGWWAYEYKVNTLPDYEKIGVWTDAYYMSSKQNAAMFWAFPREKMLAGEAGKPQVFQVPYLGRGNWGFPFPANFNAGMTPPEGQPGIFIRPVDDEYFSEISDVPGNDTMEIFEFRVDWDDTSKSKIEGPTKLSMTEFNQSLCGGSTLSCAPQPGPSTAKLSTMHDTVMNKVSYRNFGDHESIVGSVTVNAATSGEKAGIRWFELQRKTGEKWTLFQEGTLSPDNDWRYLGNIGIDASGNIAIAYQVSSSSTYGSIRASGRLVDDPINTLPQGEMKIVDGNASVNSGRLFDYCGMGVDPEDGCTFWHSCAYAKDSGTVRVSALRFDACRGEDAAPEVKFASPEDGDTLKSDEKIEVEIEASDDDAVDTVELYLDGAKIESFTKPPYTATIEPLDVGEHELKAIATDSGGQSTESEVVTISIETADETSETTSDDDDDDTGSTSDDDDDDSSASDDDDDDTGSTSDDDDDDSNSDGDDDDDDSSESGESDDDDSSHDADDDDDNGGDNTTSGCGCLLAASDDADLAVVAFSALALVGLRRRRRHV